MNNDTKRILKKKAVVEAQRNIHDVAAAYVANDGENAKKRGEEYTREDANKARMDALLAMQGINRED